MNDYLYARPKVGQNIMDIMLRFCVYKVTATNIEKAFLMIAMSPEDRDALCFLWVDNVNKQILNVVIWRFTRVIFGSPFLLNATIKHHRRTSPSDSLSPLESVLGP